MESLPVEILSYIARNLAYRADEDAAIVLGPYALVNKTWQAVFEAEIYSSVWLRSPEDIDGVIVGQSAPRPKKGLTFQKLDELTTGPQEWRRARRKAIRSLMYWVTVPHWLCDKLKAPRENYRLDNHFRLENNQAFTRHMPALFDYLASSSSTWSSRLLTLSVVLQAENVYDLNTPTEPGAVLASGGEPPLADYLAHFSQEPILKPVSCIGAVAFPVAGVPNDGGKQNGISLPAQLKIASACITLARVDLNGDSYVPTDSLLLFGKLNAFGRFLSLLRDLPGLINLSLNWRDQAQSMAPQVVTSIPRISPDRLSGYLSRCLHRCSSLLRTLRLHGLDITPALFVPFLDSKMVWPHLEVFTSTSVPIYIYSFPIGKTQPLIFELSPEEDEDEDEDEAEEGEGNVTDPPIPRVSVADRVGYLPNRHPYLAIATEYFDELYACAGCAARGMPKLKELHIDFESPNTHGLRYDGERKVLRFESFYGYAPTTRVLENWGVNAAVGAEGMVVKGNVLEVEAEPERWPTQ